MRISTIDDGLPGQSFKDKNRHSWTKTDGLEVNTHLISSHCLAAILVSIGFNEPIFGRVI